MTISESTGKRTDSALRQLLAEQRESDKAILAEQEQLANQFKELRLQGAPKQVIMDALGLTEDDYSKFSSREDVKQAVITSETQRAQSNLTFDNNWDAVENLALQQVAKELSFSPDPEFALRAAAVANKAVRRRREDAKLAAQGALAVNQQVNTNNIAILNLPKVFMQQLVVETEEAASKQLALQRGAVKQRKLMDSADVAIVKDTFGFSDPVQNELAKGPAKSLAGTARVATIEAEVVGSSELDNWLLEGGHDGGQ